MKNCERRRRKEKTNVKETSKWKKSNNDVIKYCFIFSTRSDGFLRMSVVYINNP